MNRVNVALGILTILLSAFIAAMTASSRVSAVETKTLRNEQDIRELRTEIRDTLRVLEAESKSQRDLILATKTAIEVHAAQERRGR